MTSLYKKLFTYRGRPDRSPLENFLNEALADVLNRFPYQVAKSTVLRMLGGDQAIVLGIEKYWKPDSNFKWTTQRVIDGGIIDLLLEIDDTPFIIVEIKINAGFQLHQSTADEFQSVGSANQLTTYGRWLASKTHSDWGGAIIVLTHWTPTPSDFISNDQAYVSKYRRKIRWADLARWLNEIVRPVEYEFSDWACLTSELTKFLREQGMDNELATTHDLAALQIYVSSADRIRSSIARIWNNSRPVWHQICRNPDIAMEITTKYGCVWKWRYLSRNDLRQSYLAVGIRFPPISGYPESLSPDGSPYLFVELATEDNNAVIRNLTMPECWIALENMRIATRSLRKLPVDADLFVSEAEDWSMDRMKEVASVLS